MIHQASLYEFQRELKLGMEYELWRYKYRIQFYGSENTENVIESTFLDLKIN